MRVVKLAANIGARIEGVLAGNVDVSTAAQINAALPSYGGTTTWASTEAAYDQLPAPRDAVTAEERQYREEFVSDYYETEHPVVRVHPETGRRVLLLGQFVKRFVGLGSAESTALFNLLQDPNHQTGEHHSVELGTRRHGDLGQPRDTALRRCRLRRPVPRCCTASRWPGTSRSISMARAAARSQATPRSTQTWCNRYHWPADGTRPLGRTRSPLGQPV